MANGLSTPKPAVGFWEYQFVTFSRVAAGLILIGSFREPALGLTFIGLCVLIAGHAIAKAIKDSR
jgi:hypothetical protein